MTFGDRLLYLRGIKGWSQKFAADHSGISQSNYSKYESGIVVPNPKTIDKIAGLYQVHPCALTGFDQYQLNYSLRRNVFFLVMLMNRSGLILLNGTRGEDNRLMKNEIRLSSKIPKAVYPELIEWEYLLSHADWKHNLRTKRRLEQMEIDLLARSGKTK